MNSHKVVADYIDETQFSFICPFCSTPENIVRHFHGNCLDFCSNRWEHRGGHGDCMGKNFFILICKDTRRKLKRANKKVYEDYLKQESQS